MAENEDNKSYLQLESVQFTKMNPFIVMYFSKIPAVVPMVTRILKQFQMWFNMYFV